MILHESDSRAQCDFAPEIAAHSGDESVVYKRVGQEPLYLSLYFPPHGGQDGMRPILLLVHGGGWRGKKVFPEQPHWMGDYLGFLARYYAEQGYFCASIDYRLLGQPGPERENELIDLYEDCMDAAEYVRRHAADWHADARRMLVLGESAGGYLAAAMATLPLRACGIFAGAILVNAITDLTDAPWAKSIAGACAHPLLAGKSLAEKAALLSPCANIRPGLPPVLLLHGDRDSCVAPMHSASFYEKSLACGNDAELVWIDGAEHAFLLAEYTREKGRGLGGACAGVRAIDAWLRRHSFAG